MPEEERDEGRGRHVGSPKTMGAALQHFDQPKWGDRRQRTQLQDFASTVQLRNPEQRSEEISGAGMDQATEVFCDPRAALERDIHTKGRATENITKPESKRRGRRADIVGGGTRTCGALLFQSRPSGFVHRQRKV